MVDKGVEPFRASLPSKCRGEAGRLMAVVGAPGKSLFSCKEFGTAIDRLLCVHVKYKVDNNANMRSSA